MSLGNMGWLFGEIDKDRKLNYEFIKLDETEFTIIEQNVDRVESKEELVEKINELVLEEKKYYEISLIGNRNFNINVREILKLISKCNIIKIKDLTCLKYNIEEIKNEKSIRGIFVQEMIKKYDDKKYTKEEVLRAIEIGLEVLN